MIGQKRILEQIDLWAASGEFPRFLIITGARGSGKTMLSKYIVKKLNSYHIACELGVDAVREAVENCYRCNGVTVYSFFNADKMSAQAKNALLKITEEPPRSAHFVMTVQDPSSVLETLKSRGTVISMQPYTFGELREYMETSGEVNDSILKVADSPGDVEELRKMNIQEFYSFCEKVIENIGTVSGVNAFKIAQKLKFKEEGEGYDPVLFMRVVKAVLFSICLETEDVEVLRRYKPCLKATSECIRDLQLTGVKKDSTVDIWILKMREALNNG